MSQDVDAPAQHPAVSKSVIQQSAPRAQHLVQSLQVIARPHTFIAKESLILLSSSAEQFFVCTVVVGFASRRVGPALWLEFGGVVLLQSLQAKANCPAPNLQDSFCRDHATMA